jgi:manganese efflux pump family protein
VLKLIAVIVPLALDSFGAAIAVGLASVSPAQRRRALLLFPLMETASAALGLALGLPLGRAIGGVADYAGAAAVIGVGVAILRESDRGSETGQLATASGWRLAAVGVAISVDELVLGLSLGLLGLPAPAALLLIAIQAILVSQVGIRLGERLGAGLGDRAERLGGLALVLIGLLLLVEAIAA